MSLSMTDVKGLIPNEKKLLQINGLCENHGNQEAIFSHQPLVMIYFMGRCLQRV